MLVTSRTPSTTSSGSPALSWLQRPDQSQGTVHRTMNIPQLAIPQPQLRPKHQPWHSDPTAHVPENGLCRWCCSRYRAEALASVASRRLVTLGPDHTEELKAGLKTHQVGTRHLCDTVSGARVLDQLSLLSFSPCFNTVSLCCPGRCWTSGLK